MIATTLAWLLSLSGAPLVAATDAASAAAGAQALGRPVVAPAAARDVAPESGVLLNVGAIVTTSEEAATLRASVGSFEGRRLHLVQFSGPIQPEWYGDLEATGAEVIQYIPSFAYLVYGDASALARVQEMAQSSPAVRWDGAYLDRYKIQPTAQAETRAKLGLPADQDSFAIQLVADPVANAETVSLIESRAVGAVRQRWEILKYVNLVVALPLGAVDAIAARPDVVSIDRHVTPQMFDERQDRIVTGQLTGNAPTPGDYLAYLSGKGFTQAQFDASAFVVDVSDSGIDNGTTTPNHFGLRVGGDLANPGRVQYNRLEGTPQGGSTQGCDGHGNLNAHIVASYVPDPATLPAPAIHADAAGFRYGLGVCPFVRVGSSVIFDPSTYTNPNLPDLQARAYQDKARISTNSWGANTWGTYTVEAQTFDALVRDAQPATSVVPTAGNQEMVVIFSAGNAGPTQNSIGSPGVAKNVIAVGAAEGVQAFGGSDSCSIGDAAADSANDMWTGSSRGPTSDGRFKPDVVAPGTHISGGVFQIAASVAGNGVAAACFTGTGVCGGLAPSDFFPAGQQFYTASSGTSHSAPAVAGGAALVRQHFINNGLTPPSPAMTKALLVQSARYMNGTGASDTLPSNSQGMGMMNLEAYFSQAAGPRILLDQRPGNLFWASGQRHTITGNVADSGRPFRVTLAWTDAAGATFGAAYVNNLDLEVTAGGTTYKGNVFSGAASTTGGATDWRNNVESVFLPAGLSGLFSVRVIATNIAGDGVPGVGGALDQDYALVISNATPEARRVVVAGAASLVAEGCGSGNGALDPGETSTVSLCLQNAGTADTTNAVATLQPTGGVTNPSAPQSYGVLVAGASAVCRSFSFVVGNVNCGTAVTLSAQVQDGASDLGSVSWALQTGTPAILFNEAFDGVAAPALPPGWTSLSEYGADAWTTVSANADSAPHAAFVNDPPDVSLTSLVTPDIVLPAIAAPIVLTFRHAYDMEREYDGGVLEIKIGGGYFQDILTAGGSFAAGGYNLTLSSLYGSPLPWRQAWSGRSGNYVTTIVNLPASAGGQTIQLRWRRGTDRDNSGGGGTGWRVDTISLHAGQTCCAPPALSIDDVSVVEGSGGPTTATFAVRLSSASGQTVSVQYAAADGTATILDGDYAAASGTLIFDPGATTLPVSVTVNGDDRYEADETFTVRLSGANAPIRDGQGLGTIVNDDGEELWVFKSGAGSGTVTSSPAGIDCGATCGHLFGPDTAVTLTATPTAESTFTGWSGASCAGTGPCVVTMDEAKDTTATFEKVLDWTATSTTYAPEARSGHTAVWTGSRMIVWGGGGSLGQVNTGGIYDPATDSWAATSTTNAPLHRSLHTAVWTGSKMIAWGGVGPGNAIYGSGGVYDPPTDSWKATRWTGSELNRYLHTAVWTGSKMIVWGGLDIRRDPVNTGFIYDPVGDTWTATSTTNAPPRQGGHTAVWTGSRMIVWGGTSGGIYDPATDTWTAMSTTNAPVATDRFTAVWTGSRMIVWGGHGPWGTYEKTGGRYDPATDTWTPTSTTNAPTGRESHTAVWTGSKMIVWAGSNSWQSYLNTGGAYDPTTDTWTATATTNAPTARYYHTAVWAGSKMIVWGGGTYVGTTTTPFFTGGVYDPSPSLSLDDVSVVEGNAGTKTATFTVTLSEACSQTVSVSYATADGTATTADGDYVAASGTLAFGPGVTTLPVIVTVNGDARFEADETFTLNMSNPVNGRVLYGQGVGTIVNDDPRPTCTSFSISPTSVSPDYEAGSQLVTITGLPSGCAGGSWTTSGNGSWITVAPAGGSGPGSATVSWTQNTGAQRTGSATIAGRIFTVTQGPPPTCTSFSISPTSASPDYQAGSQLVTITGLPASCIGGAWTTSGNGSWLTVTPASGSAPGSATVSWAENTGVPRTGGATIAGQTFTVTQTGPGTGFFTIPPCRLVDTRAPGPFGGPILFGTSRTILVGGACGVSASASAVALNLTVTAPTAAGNCRLYPDPGVRPPVSNINYAAGQTRANNAIVSLGPGGTLTVYCAGAGSGSVHLILDVNGYFE